VATNGALKAVDQARPQILDCHLAAGHADGAVWRHVALWSHPVTDRRWAMLNNAEPGLIQTLASVGVVRIEIVAAFPDQDRIAIWLCTSTDTQRDEFPRSNPYLDEVRTVLLASGFTPDELEDLMTVAQSQETVDRDYDGSWFYALR
jgi:hypothetical protein